MEFAEVVRRRRMVRSYDPERPVPRATVQQLLELAVRAPSAGHTQGWHFLVLELSTDREAFWAATGDAGTNPWLARMQAAPVLVIVFSDKDAYLDRYAEPDKGWTDRDEAHWPVPYWDTDAAMAAMIALLAVVDAGLVGCFFGVPGECWDALRAAFGVPFGLRPVGVLSIGYPAPDVRSPSLRRGRRPFAEIVSYGRFGASS
jgi:nitroreductase